MKINKNIIKELNDYLEEFNLTEIEYTEKDVKVKVSKSRISKNVLIVPIDDFGVDGDYVESQAFAFLAIRSFLELPISFPDTTGCKSPTTGGEVVKNF